MGIEVDADFEEGVLEDARPSAVCEGARGARVGGGAAVGPGRLGERGGAAGREPADPDHGCRAKAGNHGGERIVAGREERVALGAGQLVGGDVAPAPFHEGERTVVPHEGAAEEALRRPEAVSRPAPEACPAHLAAGHREAEHRALGVLAAGALDGRLDPEPVPDHRGVAEGDPRSGPSRTGPGSCRGRGSRAARSRSARGRGDAAPTHSRGGRRRGSPAARTGGAGCAAGAARPPVRGRTSPVLYGIAAAPARPCTEAHRGARPGFARSRRSSPDAW